jgi:catechol 1,2-dioxygenase
MKRRTFIKNAGLCAVAVSTYGFIRFDGNKYIGDCETTTDILGPFYIPDSPERNDLLIKGQHGDPVELSGIICHKDCVTPYNKAKIELWHCNNYGVYDVSKEFRHRGTTYSDKNGNYLFKTIMPVPYNAGNGQIRPAHFHLMITAEEYQPLVTQLYFSGDRYINSDPYASSPKALKRILDVQNLNDGTKKVSYNVGMAEILPVEPASIEKLVGVYKNVENDNMKLNVFKRDNTLWIKNEVFGNRFEYIGNNTFEYGGMPEGIYWRIKFEMLASGDVKATSISNDVDLTEHSYIFIKKK